MSTSKLLVWLSGEVKTPPFSTEAREVKTWIQLSVNAWRQKAGALEQ